MAFALRGDRELRPHLFGCPATAHLTATRRRRCPLFFTPPICAAQFSSATLYHSLLIVRSFFFFSLYLFPLLQSTYRLPFCCLFALAATFSFLTTWPQLTPVLQPIGYSASDVLKKVTASFSLSTTPAVLHDSLSESRLSPQGERSIQPLSGRELPGHGSGLSRFRRRPLRHLHHNGC